MSSGSVMMASTREEYIALMKWPQTMLSSYITAALRASLFPGYLRPATEKSYKSMTLNLS